MPIILSVLFALMCIVAFNGSHIWSGVIALVQVILCVVTILMKKNIIKTPKNWLYKLPFILALILILPYFSSYNTYNSNRVKNFKWDDIALNNVIPKPKPLFGEIISNSKDGLSLEIYKTSSNQYDKYVKECKDMGFTIDLEQLGSSFYAYNTEGYQLKLDYYKPKKRMKINLDVPMQLGTLKWPDSEYAKLIPIPESKVGKIEKDDETGFVVYVGEMPKESFNNYIKLCVDNGFKIDPYENSKSYTAKNADGYKINVEYRGYNIVKITVSEPEYKVDLEIECSENLMLSKYDVKVYVDKYSYQGTLKHGTTETYTKFLKKGEHTLNFENVEDSSIKGEIKINVSKAETIKIKINCTSSQIIATDGKEELLTMIDTKGLDATTAKDKLKNVGFTNITIKSDDGNTIIFEDTSKWEVISQSAESGTQISKNTEIVLSCHKKEEDPVPSTENTTTPTTPNVPTAPTQTEPKPEDYSDEKYQYDAEDVFRMQIEDSCPYGVKIHSVTGYLAKTYEGNGIWFFKVKITVTNAYKAKYDAVAEGRIDVANGNDITYFLIY